MTPEQYAPLIGVAAALGLVILRNRRQRTLRPHLLWVTPLIVTVLIGFGLWATTRHPQFGPYAWISFIAALALGALAGWWRGKTITITRAADGSLKAQASPLGLILIVGLLAARMALRELMQSHADEWRLDPVIVADAFMVFAIGLIIAQRVEMYIRARRIQHGQGDAHLETAS